MPRLMLLTTTSSFLNNALCDFKTCIENVVNCLHTCTCTWRGSKSYTVKRVIFATCYFHTVLKSLVQSCGQREMIKTLEFTLYLTRLQATRATGANIKQRRNKAALQGIIFPLFFFFRYKVDLINWVITTPALFKTRGFPLKTIYKIDVSSRMVAAESRGNWKV